MIGDDDDLYAPRAPEPQPWEPDENATATINYTSGTTARPKGVQITHRNIWINAVDLRAARRRHRPRRLPAHAADVPRQRLGDAVRDDRPGRPAGRAAQGRRRRDPAPGRASTASPSCARRRRSSPPCSRPRQTWEGEIPGRDRVRIIVAGAPPPTRTIVRVEEELGWEFIQIYGLTETSPLLTVNRSRGRSGTTCAPRSGPPSWSAPGRRRSAYACRIDDERRGAGPVQRRARGLLGAARGDRARRSSDGWFHTGDGGVIGDDGYLTIQDRKKDVIITGGENVSSIEVEDVHLLATRTSPRSP